MLPWLSFHPVRFELYVVWTNMDLIVLTMLVVYWSAKKSFLQSERALSNFIPCELQLKFTLAYQFQWPRLNFKIRGAAEREKNILTSYIKRKQSTSLPLQKKQAKRWPFLGCCLNKISRSLQVKVSHGIFTSADSLSLTHVEGHRSFPICMWATQAFPPFVKEFTSKCSILLLVCFLFHFPKWSHKYLYEARGRNVLFQLLSSSNLFKKCENVC